MRAPIALIVLAAALLPQGCAKIEARDLIREGNALYGEGKHAQAIEKYNGAEELEPDGVTLYWNRACAAESLVLLMKNPEQREQRAQYADLALRDFQTWLDRLEEKTEEDRQQANDHRLALLDADERCEDLLAYWFEKHRGNPSEEALYGVIARTYARCGDAEQNYQWHVKRTENFPESVRAWHALAIRKFEPLWPDPESGLPFNEQVPPDERIRAADDVIKTLDQATALDAKFRDAYVWRSMAYSQRSLARVVIEDPKLPEEKLEAVLSREDLMLAWKQQKAVCDLEDLLECPADVKPEGPCCPPPPLTTEERAKDLELRKALEQEIKAAEEREARRKRRRRRP